MVQAQTYLLADQEARYRKQSLFVSILGYRTIVSKTQIAQPSVELL